MPDKRPVELSAPASSALAEETLETCRLLVEFLHAAYATRRLDQGTRNPGETEIAHGAERRDVSPHAMRAATHVYQHGERTIGQLASGLGISYGWASRVVEELEQLGYVQRERDADDRRVVHVRLVDAARDEVKRASRWRSEAVAKALEPLTEGERAGVRLFLRDISELLRRDLPERA